MSTEPWHIQMLGGLVLRRGGESISHFPTEKSRLLLAYLAAYPQLTPTREELVERFWPDSDVDAGRVSLRQALAQVRRILEPEDVPTGTFLIADRSKVCLNAELFATDVMSWDRSRALASRAEGSDRLRLLEEALPHYGGEFMPGAYMEWALQERQHRQDQYVDLLLQLADAQIEHGRYIAARESAQLVLRTDAFEEEAHERLIRAFALEGNLALARRQYEKLCTLLRDELNLDPSPKLRTLYTDLEHLYRSRPGAESLSGTPLSSSTLMPEMETPRLPLRLTRFFGRTDELRLLRTWLNDPALRLITLTGIGGVGKTRLSLEAAQVSTRFGASVTYVPLSETYLPEHLIPTILQNLCLPPAPRADPLLRLRAALGALPHLLVLDNFEQIAETAAETLWQMLEEIPTLACLITSRQPLNLPGEHELALTPLPVPDSHGTADDLIENPTVQLLVDRVRASRPDFQVTAVNAPTVATLCARLEGIPLAVELVSGWARDLTIGQMQERMSQRFNLLVSRQRGVPPRHQSLRATVESSFQLLSPSMQQFFLRLAVFRGGWRVEAAQIGEDRKEYWDVDRQVDVFAVADGLRVLREHSLITVQEVQDHVRYGMLETLREFAWEQMPPTEQEQMRHRHASYWMTFGEEIEPKLNGPELGDCLNQLEEERANLTAALTWCVEAAEIDLAPSPVEIGMRTLGALWKFWDMRGSAREGRQFTERLLACAGAEITTKVLARAHMTAGMLAKAESDYPAAIAHAEQSLGYWRQEGSREGIGSALSNIGSYLSAIGEMEEALRHYEEALSIFREMGIVARIATSLNNIGSLQRMCGDFDVARANLQEALALRRQIGDLRMIWSTLNNLAALDHNLEDYAAAVQGQQEALAVARELEDRYAIGISLVNLGNNYLSLKDLTTAYACFTESLQLHTAVASRFGQAYALEGLAIHAVLTDRPERAGILLGAAQSLREVILAKQPSREQELVDAPFLPLATNSQFLAGLTRGRTLPLEEVISLALA